MKGVRPSRSDRAGARLRALVLCAIAVGNGGCVASIEEHPIYGAAAPSWTAPSQLVPERSPPSAVVRAVLDGTRVDVSVTEDALCRETLVTPMAREVDVRRSFTDDAQERNLVLSLLLGAGIAFLQFGASQVHCTQACSSSLVVGTYSMLGLAAIPIGFAAFNALRVQERRVTEAAPPQIAPGAWRTCSTRPLAGEPIVVTVDGQAQNAVTGATGHAVVDLSAAPGVRGSANAGRVVIHHAGSPDVRVDVAPAP